MTSEKKSNNNSDKESNVSFLTRLSTFSAKDFTKKENLIIEFIKDNLERIPDMNIEVLAGSVDIGYSAVYGLLRKLNLPKYRNFLVSVAKDVHSQNNIEAEEGSLKSSYYEFINRNDDLNNKEDISKTVSAIKAAKKVFLISDGSLFFIANNLCLRLLTMKFDAVSLQLTEHEMESFVKMMAPNDVVMVYTLLGNNYNALNALKAARDKGIKVIAISGKQSSPVVSSSDWTHILSLPQLDDSQNEFIVDNALPIMYLNDLISKNIADENKK